MTEITKRITILKTGSTLDELIKEQGDFEDWVYRGMDVPATLTQTIDPRVDEFPNLASIAGVVITGSHDMVTEHQDWSERSAEWLRTLISANVPTLGICYGHQLIAYALGGEVGDNPRGREFGTKTITMNNGSESDMLLGEEYPVLKGHLCHTQTVIRAPEQAEVLATTDMDSCVAFRVGQHTWGVQFHPEFNRSALLTYTRAFTNDLIAQGDDPASILETVEEISSGTDILKRFGDICLQQINN